MGAISLFLGTANPIIHIPLLILFYPSALYLIAMHATSARQAFKYGLLCATLGASLALYWLAIPVHYYGYFPWALAVPIPICAGLYIGFYGAVFSYLMQKAKKFNIWFKLIFAGLLWYALEDFRSYFLTGLTWLNISAGLASFPALVQGASVIGATGLSAFYAFIGCALVIRKKHVQLIALVLLLGIVFAGFFRISHSTLSSSSEYYLLVQGNLSQDVKWNKDMQETTIDKYLKLTEEGILKAQKVRRDIKVVVFPETAMPFFLQDEEEYLQRFYDLATKYNLTFLIGGVSYDIEKSNVYLYNSLFLIPPLEEIAIDKSNTPEIPSENIYSKQHLLPFGEYVPPFLDFEILKPFLQGIGGFTPKENQKPLQHIMHKDNPLIAALICYEATFSDLAQVQVEEGAQVLVNISNDAWYGYSSAAKQHLDISALRALEQNRYLVRATNTGITAGINPYGQILAHTKLFTDETLSINVHYTSQKSIYHKIYHLISPIMNLLFFAFLCIVYFTRKKAEKGLY